MKPRKVKKCSICKVEYTPYSSLAKACSPKCALKVVAKKKAKQDNKELLTFRKDNKKISEWIAEAQTVINTYVRVRDSGKPCISCGRYHADDSGEWDAGHYRSRGAAPHLRFNLHNIRRQCKYCNRHLGGNYSEYRIRLVALAGEDYVNALETNNGYKKFTREYCERVKRIFAKKTRIKKKRLSLQ